MYVPEPEIKVPVAFFFSPPWILIGELIALFQVAPLETITKSSKDFVPVVEVNVKLPLDPAPIVVVPVTEKLDAPIVNDDEFPTTKFPSIKISPVEPVKTPPATESPPLKFWEAVEPENVPPLMVEAPAIVID